MPANATPAPSPRQSSPRRQIALLALVALTFTWAVVGCNSYPLLPIKATPYLEITETLKREKTQAVDILFVVDNSDSMKQEQEKLARNFKTFIEELTAKDIGNYQIGIISTDMYAPLHRGKLLSKDGQPKIVSRRKLPAPKVIEAFAKNINLGIGGISFEKPLDAMRAALSPKLLEDDAANKGFLRPGALLAVIFVGDEDDCSHKGGINEDGDPGVCNLPSSEILRDDDGNVIPGADGKPVKGKLDQLTPVKEYIDFLKGLNRTVIVGGLIGDPHIYKDTKKRISIDPDGGCDKDNQCTLNGQAHFCGFVGSKTRRCGGCTTGIDPITGFKDANAAPGYRLYEVIKAFGGSDHWFPICGDDDGFKQALFEFARAVVNALDGVSLTRIPGDMETITVKVTQPETGEITTINKALATKTACQTGKECKANQLCGQDDRCYRDGWVYFLESGKGKLKFSGTAQQIAAPGTEINISYVAANCSAASPCAGSGKSTEKKQ